MDHIAPLVIAGLICALLGCVLMVISSRIERRRRERNTGQDTPL